MRVQYLKVGWFGKLFEGRLKIPVWNRKCNEEGSHRSLGYAMREEFAYELSGEYGFGTASAIFPLRLRSPKWRRILTILRPW